MFSAESRVAWFNPEFDSPHCTVLCSGVYADLGQEVLCRNAQNYPEPGRLRGSINCSTRSHLALLMGPIGLSGLRVCHAPVTILTHA